MTVPDADAAAENAETPPPRPVPVLIPSGRVASRAWFVTGFAVFTLAADLATKAWALNVLSPANTPFSPRIRVIPGCLDFLLAFNTGGAFSLLDDKTWVITAFAILATAGIGAWCAKWVLKAPHHSRLAAAAFGLVLGGAIGNVIDRVRYAHVVDFIHAYIRSDGMEYSFPTFNVADSGIVVGIGVFLILSLFTRTFEEGPATAPPVAA